MESSLSSLLCYLVSGHVNNFYARVLAALELQKSDQVPLMGVTVKDRKFILLYNPAWYEKASYEEVLAVIEHEVCHLIWEHVPRTIEMLAWAVDAEERARLMVVLPLAADMAVNSFLVETNPFIKEHQDMLVLPDSKVLGFHYPHKKSMEWYAQKLLEDSRNSEEKQKILRIMGEAVANILGELGYESETPGGDNGNQNKQEKKEKKGEKGKGDKKEEKGEQNKEKEKGKGKGKGKEKELPEKFNEELLAGHRKWLEKTDRQLDDDLSLANELRDKIKQVVQRAVEDHTKNHGTLPACIEEQIENLLKRSQIPFTHILRTMVITTQKYRKVRSVTRPKRRHIGVPELCPFPGHNKHRKFRVVWCTDTSGSMGKEELELGLNELRALQKADPEIEIHVIEADAAVEHEYLLDRPESKINYKVHGRGGTSFDPALQRAQELQPDICFYFTDGYAPAPAVESRVSCPFAWIITPGGVVPDETWGRVIKTRGE